ncbi:MAG: transcriptional regulator, RpiR family [Rubritepida sp.]|nr:transcriptional regulator, RpiR family [Rubritepida sp.]
MTASPPNLLDLLRQKEAELTPNARRVLRFIVDNPYLALAGSAAQLAAQVGTSNATVVRTVQSLGFEGLPDLKRAIVKSLEFQPAGAVDALRTNIQASGAEAGGAIDLVLDVHRKALEALSSPASRAAMRAGVMTLEPIQRILVYGIGPAFPLAQYLELQLNRIGRPSFAAGAAATGLADRLMHLTKGDGVVAIAYGHFSGEAVTLFEEAQRLNLPVVLVTDSMERRLTRHADVVIIAPRGDDRRIDLHAATLLVLDALTMGLAACDGDRAVGSLERLINLRDSIEKNRGQIGKLKISRPKA